MNYIFLFFFIFYVLALEKEGLSWKKGGGGNILVRISIKENKFVRTKMRQKTKTKIELQKDICQNYLLIFVEDFLQLYCRLFTGYLQIICRQGAVSRLIQ